MGEGGDLADEYGGLFVGGRWLVDDAICFETAEFPTVPEGDLEFCNGQPGRAAAEWARGVLRTAGFECAQVMQEDYGWGFWLEHACPVWVAMSFAGGDDDAPAHESRDAHAPAEWWLSASHEPMIFSLRWWRTRREGAAVVARVRAVLEEAVRREFGGR